MTRRKFWHIVFDTMSLFWLIMSFVDVLLLCFTNFTTWTPLWTTQQRNNLAKVCFDNMTCFGRKASFIKWFCSISLIWPLYRFFEQVHLIFTKYLWGVKLFPRNGGIIWLNIILILCLDLHQWRHLWHNLLLFH